MHDSHLLARAHHQAQAITPNSPPDPSLERQATRARQLVHLGELSAARQALTAGPLAPGTAETLQELRDPTRRPNEPYAPLHPSISELQPDQPVHLPDDLIIMNLRRARKGAAPGLSGLTTDTLRILLDDDTATTNLIRVARHFAPSQYPQPKIARAIGLGRMVALTKPNGRVRGIVVGDVLRRLVSRCLAQKYVQPIHTACQPHQFALATRSGTEAVVHALTAVTEANPTHTILSVDGVGAYDNISRNSMLQGLRDVPGFSYSAPATVSGRPRSHMRHPSWLPRHFGHHGQIHYQSSTPNFPSMQLKSWNASNTLQRLIPSIQAAAAAAQALEERGWTPPSWTELTQGIQPDPTEANTKAPRTRGWPSPPFLILQSLSTLPIFFGSSSSVVSVCTSHSQHVLVGAVALLTLLADHRAACARSGVLRSRGGPLERAAARICREGGARVTTNTRLADLNIQNLSRVDDRRIEVIANGLPMLGGSQLAVDTTLVSPLTRTGEPRSRGGTYAGAALHDARRSKERTYPELLNNRRCRLVVLGIEVGGRWSNEASNFICMLAKARARSTSHGSTSRHHHQHTIDTQPATTKTPPPNETAGGWCIKRTWFGQSTFILCVGGRWKGFLLRCSFAPRNL